MQERLAAERAALDQRKAELEAMRDEIEAKRNDIYTELVGVEHSILTLARLVDSPTKKPLKTAVAAATE